MQTHESIQDLVFTAVAEACNFDRADITAESNLVDLGIDSLNMAVIVARVELARGCHFLDEDIIQLLHAEVMGEFVRLVDETVERREAVQE